MKYKNASDILPDELLKEVQKYSSGEVLYILSPLERKKWGHGTGARTYYKQRNEEIKQKYFHKVSIDGLAKAYGLSAETIRKIVYK
ncbi:MAG: CD3324 family protein [Vallitaleaceae bacterium]|jgi:Mor family transcriptional regulator|nr:CD3324 family protein [Vallitaleaceae bacterium]